MSTLLLGQTDYFSEKDLLSVFTDKKMVVVGKLSKPSRKIRQLELTDVINLNTVFKSYDIDEVVYLSNFLNCIDSGQSEFHNLERLLESLAAEPKIKLIYVAGPDLNYSNDSGRRIVSQAAENICLFYQKQYDLDLKIIRSLHLYAASKPDDVLGIMTQPETVEAKPAFKINPRQTGYFIYPLDLISLLSRILDNWQKQLEIISVGNAFNYTFEELAASLYISEARREQIFDSRAPLNSLKDIDSDLRRVYAWFPKISLMDDLPITRKQTTTVVKQKTSFVQFIYSLGEQKGYMKFLQLLVFFILSETMTNILGQQVYFKLIDYRLLFVTLTGLIFGTTFGLLAALLASISLAVHTIILGTSISTLFFEPSNWVIYLVYFIISAVGGSIRERAQDEAEVLTAQNDNLIHQLDNGHNFIEDLLDRQNQLTNQIISRQDSYGQIYHFLETLNTPYIDVFLMHVVQELSDIFDSSSVRIYRASSEQGVAQLQLTASRQGRQNTIQIDGLKTVLDHIAEHQIWVNHRLREDYPMFMAVLTYKKQDPLYIMIETVPSDKMSLYHQNVFKVLTGLIQQSYEHICFYSQQMASEQYLAHTDYLILNEPTFRRQLEFLERTEIGQFRQRVFYIQAETPEAQLRIAKVLKEKMTLSDLLGVLNGDLYLVLSSHTGISSHDWHTFWTENKIITGPVANLDEVLAQAQLVEKAI